MESENKKPRKSKKNDGSIASVGVPMIPQSEAEEKLNEVVTKFVDVKEKLDKEIMRLTTIEQDYIHLLTLVKVVARQNNLAIDQHVKIEISKKEQEKSKSWEDMLNVHFMNRKSSLLIQV